MIGDKLLITSYHREAASSIWRRLQERLSRKGPALAVSIAGESGCGKSETAAVLADLCRGGGYKVLLFQQDDYFVYPPRSNYDARLRDISWVGPREVRLDLLERHIAQVKSGEQKTITRPLVLFEEDRIAEEEIEVQRVDIIVVEGTYTTLLKGIDLRVFIDRTYLQTKKARLARARDPASEFLEKVLQIEHRIISSHKQMADLVIPPPEEVP